MRPSRTRGKAFSLFGSHSPAPFLILEEKDYTVVATSHVLEIASRCAWHCWEVLLAQCKLQQDALLPHFLCSYITVSFASSWGCDDFVQFRTLSEGLSLWRLKKTLCPVLIDLNG